MCYMCVCVRGKRGEKRKHKIDRWHGKYENGILKKKVYISQVEYELQTVALQGVTTDFV